MNVLQAFYKRVSPMVYNRCCKLFYLPNKQEEIDFKNEEDKLLLNEIKEQRLNKEGDEYDDSDEFEDDLQTNLKLKSLDMPQDNTNNIPHGIEYGIYSDFDSDDFPLPEGLKRVHFKLKKPLLIYDHMLDSFAEGTYEK